MEQPKEDRRIRRSKRMLKTALAELMREKEFKDIKVKDVTERADLNRGTFYLHYTDTYDLLEKIESEVLDDFQRMIDAYLPRRESDSIRPLIEPIADYMVENADICRVLFENNASDFIIRFRDLIFTNGVARLGPRFVGATKEQMSYFFSFITYGIIGVIKQWFDDDMALPNETVIDLVDKIISSVAASLLRT